MKRFIYTARDKEGLKVSGTLEAQDETAARNKLQDTGLMPVSVKAELWRVPKKLSRLDEKISLHELNLFTRQLAAIQSSGVPILTGLGALEKQAKSAGLKGAIGRLRTDLEGGLSLSAAMEKNPRQFDSLYVHMVRAGEVSGTLEQILERIAILNERNAEMQSRIRSAMRYPLLTLASMIVAFGVIISFVIPRFVVLFQSFSVTLPLPTRILIGIHEVIHRYGIGLGLGGVILFVLMRPILRTSKGRRFKDRLLMGIPVLGALLHEIYLARFSRNLSILMKSGIPIVQALELVEATTDNALIQDAIAGVREGITQGESLADRMEAVKLFPPFVIQMVVVGQSSGRVDELLSHIADYYDRETELKTRNLSSLIEPALIGMMGVMVLLLALGVFLPLWSLMDLYR